KRFFNSQLIDVSVTVANKGLWTFNLFKLSDTALIFLLSMLLNMIALEFIFSSLSFNKLLSNISFIVVFKLLFFSIIISLIPLNLNTLFIVIKSLLLKLNTKAQLLDSVVSMSFRFLNVI